MPPKRQIFRSKDSEGVFLFEIYEPLINKPNCASCHGPDHTVRGVIHLTNDITGAIQQQRIFIAAGASLSLLMLITLITILASFLHRMVIGPVKQIGVVCETISAGNFETSVAIEGNNEIARLGITVNQMITGLKERYELSKYVSSSTIQALTGQSAGKRVPLTVLFSDIRGFTAFSEAKDPETVVEALSRILSAQSEIITSLGGDIDKYVGDEIMATFTGKSGPRNSVEAALSIMELMDKSDQFSDLKVGIGINSGVALLGRIGSAQRADYTVIGDAVNIASRICAKAASGTVYITETTARFVHDSFRLSSPESLTVKGKKDAVKVFHVIERAKKRELS
jgi:adenylate cyclase